MPCPSPLWWNFEVILNKYVLWFSMSKLWRKCISGLTTMFYSNVWAMIFNNGFMKNQSLSLTYTPERKHRVHFVHLLFWCPCSLWRAAHGLAIVYMATSGCGAWLDWWNQQSLGKVVTTGALESFIHRLVFICTNKTDCIVLMFSD